MKKLCTLLGFLCITLLINQLAIAQSCTTGCTYTAPSQGTTFNLNGGQVLCITGNVTNLSGNFNGSNNQICLASGVTWTQTNALNLNGFSVINVYGTANLSGVSLGAATVTVYGNGKLTLDGGSLNGTTITVQSSGTLVTSNNTNLNSPSNTININSGAIFQTSSTTFNNNLTVNNSGAVTFTNTGSVSFAGSSTFNNAAGATVTATAPSSFKFGNGMSISNAGTMAFTNLENEEAIKFDNTSTGTITVNRRFYNHGAFKNDGLVKTTCGAGSGTCEFRVGDKGAGKAYVNNACMIVAGDVIFDGPGTLNGTLEVLPGYNLTINKIVTGSNGYLLVDGGVSTINSDGQYTGSTGANSMKFYDANTSSHDFDVNNNRNTRSVYEVLQSAPATSCSATASCSASLVVTATTCQTATNQYVLTGTLSFANTGGSTYTIRDGAASTTVATTGTSPQAFTLTGSNLVSTGSSHTLTATPSSSACSAVSTTYTSPATCLTISVTSATVCAGQTATLTATGCTGNVSWNTGSTSSSITINTSAATTTQTVLSYTATCTSGTSSVTALGTVTVQPRASAPALTVLQPTCTTPTGSITATSSGATSYTLSGPTASTNTTGIFTGLAPGSYVVTAGNGTTCTSAASTTTVSSAPTTPAVPTLTVLQPTCTTPTGSLTATASGATAYTLTGPTASTNTTGVFTGLTPGSYSVVAGNGICTSTGATTTIAASPSTPAAPVLTVQQPTCTSATGSLTAVSAGASSYTLNDGRTTVVNATGVFSALAPGSYTILASNGSCTSTASTVTIIANPGTPSTPVLTVQQPDCSTPTGSLTIVSSGATSYTLSGPTASSNTTGIFAGLAPGAYSVVAGNGSCTSAASTITVIANPGTPTTPTLTVVQPDCSTSTGSLTATSSGASSYTLSGPTALTNTTGVFINLTPGSYTILAGNGTCTSVASVTTIIANPGTPTTPTLTAVQPNCSTPTGSLTAVSSGATSYTLNGPTTSTNTTGIFVGLTGGSYSVVAGNGTCTSVASTTIITANPGTPAAPTLAVLQPDCSTPTGSLTAVSSGSSSYTLSGSNSTPVVNATGVFTGLAPGSYFIVAGNGTCSSTASTTTISANPTTPVTPTLTVQQPDCTTPTGSLTAVSAGASVYTLTGPVSATSNTGVFTSLVPGSYSVTSGNETCTSVVATTTIAVPPTVPGAPTASAVCSSTAASGSVTVTNPSAGAGITFSIDGTNYQANNLFTNLAIGTYSVTVRQNGCTSLPTSITVGQCPTPLPVGLVSFSGKWVEGAGNQLTWRTAWERSNSYFDIERSAVAQAFERIGRVYGKGTTSVAQTYAFVDEQPSSDITYYRLKQVDTDGTARYSPIIAVERGGPISLELYPNPASSELNLRLKAGQRISTVSVYDNKGNRVLYQADGKTSVPVNDLSGGVYVIEVKTATGQVFRQRFIKQ